MKQRYKKNVVAREAAVKEAAKTHNYAGYDQSPLEEAKVVEFIDKVHELVRRAESDHKKVKVCDAVPTVRSLAHEQSENRRRNDELGAELEKLSGIKTTANATKQSKSVQIVSQLPAIHR